MIKPKTYLDKAGMELWHELVDPARRVVLTAHVGPDGDAMGSALAMADYLTGLGKEACVVMPNAFPDYLGWLPGARQVINADLSPKRAAAAFEGCDLVFCLDYNSLSRTEHMAPLIEQCPAPRIMIDHHIAPDDMARLTVSNPKASSTCEIVFALMWQLGAFETMSRNCARCIYCGMMTDTGGFTYASTRAEIFFIIAQLLTKGFDKDWIYRAVYHNYSVDRMRLMGHILHDNMRYYAPLHASIFTLSKDEMARYHFIKGDAEGLVNLPLEIKGTKLSISLREDTEKPVIRVSLRSVGNFPCNKMAAEFFNGGGHFNASGGSLHMSLEDALQKAEEALEAYAPMLRDPEHDITTTDKN